MAIPDFLPNENEIQLIQIIQKYDRNEFTLIRMTTGFKLNYRKGHRKHYLPTMSFLIIV